MKRTETTFEKDGKIREIGGRLEKDFNALKMEIECINNTYFEFLSMLNLTDDVDVLIKALNSKPSMLKYIYKEKVLRDIKEGKIPIHNFLSSKYDDMESLPPDERKKKEKAARRAIGLKTTILFNEICEKYGRKYKSFVYEPRRARVPFEICCKALYTTSTHLAIDVDKFIEIYADFVEADESITRQHHQEAADAINRFFNSSVKITERELSRYFMLEGGIVKIRPSSINKVSYSRLGKRTFTTTVINTSNGTRQGIRKMSRPEAIQKLVKISEERAQQDTSPQV